MDRLGIAFLILFAVIIGITLWESKGVSEKAISLEKSLFHSGPVFNVSAIMVITILAVIYAVFW